MNLFDFGFVIPLLSEAKPLLQKVKNQKTYKVASRNVYTGTFAGKSVSITISGCGKIKSASATQFLIDTFPAQQYIHYGTAGALSDKLNIGDVISVTEVIEHDVIELFPQKNPPPRYKILPLLMRENAPKSNISLVWGKILSGDEDVITTKRRLQLLKFYKGLSVDWESAGFALTCQLNNVPKYILRGISDFAYEGTTSEYEKNRQAVINNIVRLLEHFFTL